MEKYETHAGATEHKYKVSKSEIESGPDTMTIVEYEPQEKLSDNPLILMPGWSGTHETYRSHLESFSDAGRHAFMIDAVERGAVVKEGEVPHANQEQFNAVTQYIDLLDEMDEKVNVVAYSEGAIHCLLAAALHPEKFENIVLVNPAGLIGEDNVVRLSLNFSKEVVSGVVGALRNQQLREQMKNILTDLGRKTQHPFRSFREILGLSNAELYDTLKRVKEGGVGISVMHGAEDTVFPMEKMQDYLDSGIVDGFYSVDGGHGEFLLRQKEYAEAAESILATLEDRKIQTRDM